MYTLDESGKRMYTLKVRVIDMICSLKDSNATRIEMIKLIQIINRSYIYPLLYFMLLFSKYSQKEINAIPTDSAHPARFSPDDKFSRERIICKTRFNILPTQVRKQ